MGDCPCRVNYLCRTEIMSNFLTSEVAVSYFKEVFKSRETPKFGHLHMHFVLIIYGMLHNLQLLLKHKSSTLFAFVCKVSVAR